jgi:hypothetical protein
MSRDGGWNQMSSLKLIFVRASSSNGKGGKETVDPVESGYSKRAAHTLKEFDVVPQPRAEWKIV